MCDRPEEEPAGLSEDLVQPAVSQYAKTDAGQQGRLRLPAELHPRGAAHQPDYVQAAGAVRARENQAPH